MILSKAKYSALVWNKCERYMKSVSQNNNIKTDPKNQYIIKKNNSYCLSSTEIAIKIVNLW